MSSTSLYITTNQIILKSDPNNPSTWQDLYRLVPDLRNSLCCVVCGNLLINPQSPTIGKCQHHMCRQCKDGTKKSVCVWCNDCKEYSENQTLQILLQCYKNMCIMLSNSGIFRQLVEHASQSNIASSGAGNLITLIKEGAAFQDDHQMNVGLLRSGYSSLPCTYPTSSTQTLQLNQTDKTRSTLLNSNLRNVTSSNTSQSIMYAGSDNEITIAQKPKQLTTDKFCISSPATTDCLNKSVSKKPPDVSICNFNLGNVATANTSYSVIYAGSDNKIYIGPPTTMDYLNKSVFKTVEPPPKKRISKPRCSCRCEQGVTTPGPLTCFGQRCPCYVESTACMKCKCRGCRNPFRPDGTRVRPQTPCSKISQPATLPVSGQEQQLELQKQPLLQNVNTELVSNPTKEQLNQHPMVENIKVPNCYAKIPMSFSRYINNRKKTL